MKVALLFFMVFLGGSTTLAQAENDNLIVVLTKNKKGNTLKIKSHRTVKIVYDDSLHLKGYMRVVNDSTVAVNSVVMPLSSINSILYRSFGTLFLSTYLLIGATGSGALGAILIGSAYNVELDSFEDARRYNFRRSLGTGLTYSSAAMAGVGAGLRLVWFEFPGDKWTYSVRKK